MTLVSLAPANKSKDALKKYEELWTKIRHIIRSTTNNLDKFNEKYMKIKLNSDDDLPLNKTLEFRNMIIVVRAVFHEENKYYPKAFLHECLHNDRIEVTKGIDVSKTDGSRECIICHYWFFLNIIFRFQLRLRLLC